jgi:hypothetical protein
VLIAGSSLTLHVTPAHQPGIKRTDVQPHDLDVPGHEVIPAGAIHTAKNVGTGNAAELATYIVEKGKPLVAPAKRAQANESLHARHHQPSTMQVALLEPRALRNNKNHDDDDRLKRSRAIAAHTMVLGNTIVQSTDAMSSGAMLSAHCASAESNGTRDRPLLLPDKARP